MDFNNCSIASQVTHMLTGNDLIALMEKHTKIFICFVFLVVVYFQDVSLGPEVAELAFCDVIHLLLLFC